MIFTTVIRSRRQRGAAAYFKYPPVNNQIMVNKRGCLCRRFLLVVDKCAERRRTGEREREREEVRQNERKMKEKCSCLRNKHL